MDNALKRFIRKITEDIHLYYASGYINVDATWYATKGMTFDKKIRPTKVTIHAHRNLGTATWAGNCTTKLYLKLTNGEWVYIDQVTDDTKTIDISSKTKGKKYTEMKIEVGFTSSDGSVNHIGWATIKEYYK